MTCDFMSFSTVFHSYQVDGRVIMKGCMQSNPRLCLESFSPSVGIEPSRDQATGLNEEVFLILEKFLPIFHLFLYFLYI